MLVKRGNPFFLKETVRTLTDTGALAGQRGAYRLTRPVETLQVPAPVQTVLAARIDRLPAEEKRLLQAASVIGKDVPYALLAAIAEQSEETLRRGLAHLQDAEFIYETHLFPDLEHTFKHALTHELTYGSLLQDRRRQLHAQIVAAIERLYPDRLSEHVERLAHHALRGQLWDKAVRYSRHAGTRALDRSAPREALAAFERARAALRELPESRERTEQLIDVCFEQRNALWPLGEFARLGDSLNEARELAHGLGDERRLAGALAYQASLQNIIGEPTRGIVTADGARAIGERLCDLRLRVVASFYLGLAHWFAGEPRQATGALRPLVALVEGTPSGERLGLAGLPAVLARYVLSEALAETGEFDEAIATGEAGLRIAEAAGHPYSEVWARYGLGYAHLRKGNFAAATGILEKGLALARATEIRFALPFIATDLGGAYAGSGRAAEAVPLLNEAAEASRAMGVLGLLPLSIAFLAGAYLALGQIVEAAERAQEAVALARAQQQRGWEAWALKTLGDVHARDPLTAGQAEEAYRQALALAAEQGMRPLVAHCHWGLGKLHASNGQRDEARQHVSAATMLYREMGIRSWFAKSELDIRGAGLDAYGGEARSGE